MYSRWHRFWRAPSTGDTAGLLRALIGSLALVHAVAIALNLERYYSEVGVLPWSAVANDLAAQLSLIAIAPDRPEWLTGLVIVYGLASVGMIVGVLPRCSTATAWAIHLAFCARNPYVLNGADALLGLLMFLLLFSPLELRFSSYVPRWWQPARQRWPPTQLAMRTIQVHIASVYFVTGAHKLVSEAWNQGYAVRLVLRHTAFARWPADVDSLVLPFLTWSTLAFELGFPLVFVPRLRPWILGAGVLFHVGIDISMLIPSFSAVMLISYVAFVPDETIARARSRVRLFSSSHFERLITRLRAGARGARRCSPVRLRRHG